MFTFLSLSNESSDLCLVPEQRIFVMKGFLGGPGCKIKNYILRIDELILIFKNMISKALLYENIRQSADRSWPSDSLMIISAKCHTFPLIHTLRL